MGKGKKNTVSIEPYKGVRDFYPREMFFQNYLFDAMREVAERYGYEEYGASVLETTELYEAKSSEEIVREQTYSFEDRGGRRVTLRPEMTPSVARMVAARVREFSFPLRLYAIPNCFRYERPQRGRLREHWQFNCDMFGVANIEADMEIISLAASLMEELGASPHEYEIRLNSRAVIPETIHALLGEKGHGISQSDMQALVRVMDRKDKLTKEEYFRRLVEVLGKEAAETLLLSFGPDDVAKAMRQTEAGRAFFSLLEELPRRGIVNARHDIHLMRGFDYYTGMIFEVFDTSPENHRSIFGGGRYDRLLETFGAKSVPAVGFGAGDVPLMHFLETHGLLPEYEPSAVLTIAVVGEQFLLDAYALATFLREEEGLPVSVDFTLRKLTDQFKAADKKGIPFVLVLGERERELGRFTVKNLRTGAEAALTAEEIGEYVFEHMLQDGDDKVPML